MIYTTIFHTFLYIFNPKKRVFLHKNKKKRTLNIEILYIFMLKLKIYIDIINIITNFLGTCLLFVKNADLHVIPNQN